MAKRVPRKVAVVWVSSCEDCPFGSITVCTTVITAGKNIEQHVKDRSIPDWCPLDDMPEI